MYFQKHNDKSTKRFYYFIIALRTLATALITNTHLGEVYPEKISFLAVGGLLGDSLFFAISGFCLATSAENSFSRWYGKRILRIYPTVFIITTLTYLIGDFEITSVYDLIRAFVYPTRFHFIASIMLLYVFFFFVMKIKLLRNRIPIIMAVLAVIWLTAYIFLFDKSARLDIAQEPLTKFLFFETMLFGAYVAINKDKYLNNNSLIKWFGFFASIVLYLSLKIIIDKFSLSNLQFLIVLSIFIASCMTVTAFCGVEKHLVTYKAINSILGFIAPLTLEIYVVQHNIISAVAKIEFLIFPFDFLIVVVLIIVSAFVLNRFVYCIKKGLGKIFNRSL